MTTYKVCAGRSSRTRSANLQKGRSGETGHGRAAKARYIPRSCSERTHCRAHSRRRICPRRHGTSLDQFHYAVAQDQIVRSPKTYRSEKTSDRSSRCSDELAELQELLVVPDRRPSTAGAVSSRLRVSIGEI